MATFARLSHTIQLNELIPLTYSTVDLLFVLIVEYAFSALKTMWLGPTSLLNFFFQMLFVLNHSKAYNGSIITGNTQQVPRNTPNVTEIAMSNQRRYTSNHDCRTTFILEISPTVSRRAEFEQRRIRTYDELRNHLTIKQPTVISLVHGP